MSQSWSASFHRIPAWLAVLGLLALATCGGPPPEPSSRSTPEGRAALARGAYLARSVARCEVCHSQRDWSFYSGPPVPGSERRGGPMDLFGSAERAPDISPGALADRSVSALAAALRGSGQHSDPKLAGLTQLSASDALAVASYLLLPEEQAARIEPPSAAHSTAAALGLDNLAAGRYLVTLGLCASCHGDDLAGGLQIEIPTGSSLASANLTPHPRAVGRMSRQEFVDTFQSLAAAEYERVAVPEGESNTAMPWPWLARMSAQDLGAIYDYLQTLEPVPPAPESP